MGIPMGISSIGVNTKVWLKKYRWQMGFRPAGATSTSGGNGKFQPAGSLIYTSGRPKFSLREEPINHVTEQFSFPTRATWDPLDITFLQVAGDDAFFNWIKVQLHPNTGEWGYLQDVIFDAVLVLVNGLGDIQEQILLQHCYWISLDMGSLDRADSNFADVNGSLRYFRAYPEIPAASTTGRTHPYTAS